MLFQVKIEQGRVKTKTPHKFQQYLESLEGEKCVLELIKYKIPKTVDQLSYVHVLFKYIADYNGDTLGATKRIAKERHLPPTPKERYGKTYYDYPSCRDLGKWEMSEFIERVLADCVFLEIVVPTREELGYLPK
ncbi:hypothetical protein LCGC14_2213520 [marine sediment metagenome]|uniref:Uncharacterized protein n=1 Tax=marine sediment metagenome TaxID=412755 RepID=A0A0F9FQM0_9ZZZZ